jgi:(1->4)-alpha-D-glucan 1-alpha-D-glucosylmutase
LTTPLPTAAYRLQLRTGIGLARVGELLPYLEALGVSHLYLSPPFHAREGSTHGYDVLDPNELDPAVGTAEELDRLAEEAGRRGMGILLDLVPNHMAAHPDNPWWRDVLKRGRRSPHAGAFAIEWDESPDLLLPILGKPYGQALEEGEIQVETGPDGPAARYFEHLVPLAPETVEGLSAEELAALSGTPGDPASFDRLDDLLSRQPWRLAWWRLGNEAVPYRRFFDITDLVGLRMEVPEVFEAAHRLVLDLVRQGKVQGLRIDHVDGLADPRGYLERLRHRWQEDGPAAEPWIVVEKILAPDEELPRRWPVDGTTGYEFLNATTAVLAHPGGVDALTRFYREYAGRTDPFSEVLRRSKLQVMGELFGVEVARLTERLTQLSADDRRARDLPSSGLERALTEVTAALPVYRTYVEDGDIRPQDRERIEAALETARRHLAGDPVGEEAVDFLGSVLLLAPRHGAEGAVGSYLRFVRRWQQLTGPAMAKGLEDTALYAHSPHLAFNAVGGEPEGIDPPGDRDAFHRRNRDRRRWWPRGLTTLSTHDSKRSEDVRARINVLPTVASEWCREVESWARWTLPARRLRDGREIPDPHEELFLYQTLVGVWPLARSEEPELVERLTAYLVKAAREAKIHTSWLHQDEEYEEGLTGFAREIVGGPRFVRFRADFHRFHRRVAFHGALGSLAQVILQTASPGVVDRYQGTELWDFSLVDPDNRRPVDFAARRRMLEELERRLAAEGPEALAADLLDRWPTGEIKLYTLWRLLTLRRGDPELFVHGDYLPLETEGERGEHVVAFARRAGEGSGERWLLAAVPRWTALLTEDEDLPLGGAVWGETVVRSPDQIQVGWRDRLTGRELGGGGGRLRVAELFAVYPGCVLESLQPAG